MSRKKSFTRKLNRWGFKKDFTRGPNYGVYSHKHFVRDNPQLCELMVCRQNSGSFKDMDNSLNEAENRYAQRLRSNEIDEESQHKIISSTRMRTRNNNILPGSRTHLQLVSNGEGMISEMNTMRNLQEMQMNSYNDLVYRPSLDNPELRAIDFLIQEKMKRIDELSRDGIQNHAGKYSDPSQI